jgi:hypothetical protein
LNLNNLYRGTVSGDKSIVVSGDYHIFKYSDPKKKFDKYKDPSIWAIDHKEDGGLSEVANFQNLDKYKAYDTNNIQFHKI